ncbi:hypothetical protein [Streptomyces sp. A1136]|uniref:hypothetical protein n=1 Tax=Streptomyces sp. A1136 TaxID=2563102 RepID=UPI00109E4C0B|nr:hypothetical protein [Streptomyces sp. A1136]THA56119.1 hypothetical protein E6R62_12295 [Streptomyces sp. A1136]
MSDLTHPTQQDEHLRRARGDAPTATVRALLLEIADYLTEARPMDSMMEASRVYLAAARAQRHFGIDEDRVAETTRQLLGHAPQPYAGETRGEYAIRLRAVGRAV